jgi:hypothetical protein
MVAAIAKNAPARYSAWPGVLTDLNGGGLSGHYGGNYMATADRCASTRRACAPFDYLVKRPAPPKASG